MDADIKVCVFLNGLVRAKRAFADDAVFPSQREDEISGHIINSYLSAARVYLARVYVHRGINDSWNIRNRSARRLDLLHFISLYGKVVANKNRINKILFFLAFKGYFAYLVQ